MSQLHEFPPAHVVGITMTLGAPQLLATVVQHTSGMDNPLDDPRLGAFDDQKCTTCHKDLRDGCPGHLGVLRTSSPLFHPLLVHNIEKILVSTCLHCAHLLVPQSALQCDRCTKCPHGKDGRSVCLLAMVECPHGGQDGEHVAACCRDNWLDLPFDATPAQRAARLFTACSKLRAELPPRGGAQNEELTPKQQQWMLDHTCRNCHRLNPVVSLLRTRRFRVCYAKRSLAVARMDVPSEDSFLTYENIHSILSSLPMAQRAWLGLLHPDHFMITKLAVAPRQLRPPRILDRGDLDNDLTILMKSVMRQNDVCEQTSGPTRSASILELQARLDTLFSKKFNLRQKQRVPTGLFDRLHEHGGKAKEGRIRQNLLGTVCNNSARAVIIHDPFIRIGEVSIPQLMAQRLSVPETVTLLNMVRLQNLVAQGKVLWVTANGKEWCPKLNFTLQVGNQVERQLQNGDWVVLERSPAMHKGSNVAHQVRIVSRKFVMGINQSTANTFSADFDGDQMALFAFVTMAGRVEAEELMPIRVNMITPQTNAPVVGLIQDDLAAVYRLTSTDTFLTYNQVSQLLHSVVVGLPIPTILHPVPLWTGKQIISAVLGTVYSGELDRPWMVDGTLPEHTVVVMVANQLLCGQLGESELGCTADAWQREIWVHSTWEAEKFIDTLLDVMHGFNRLYPLTVTLEDLCLQRHDEWAPLQGLNAEQLEGLVDAIRDAVLHYHDSKATMDPRVPTTFSMSQFLQAVKQRHVREWVLRAAATARLREATSSPVDVVALKSQLKNLLPQRQLRTNLNVMKYSGAKGSDENQTKLQMAAGLQLNGVWVPRPLSDGIHAEQFYNTVYTSRHELVDAAVKPAGTGRIMRAHARCMENISVAPGGLVVNHRGDVIQFRYGHDSLDPVRLLAVLVELPHDYGPVTCPADLMEKPLLLDLQTQLWGQERQQVTLRVPWHLGRLRARMHREQMRRPQEVILSREEAVAQVDAMVDTLGKLVEMSPALEWYLRFELGSGRTGWSAHVWTQCTQEVQRAWRRAMVQHGEPVGILAAQSLGEPPVQQAISTFHGLARVSFMERLTEVFYHFRTRDPVATVKVQCVLPGLERSLGAVLEDGLQTIDWGLSNTAPSHDEYEYWRCPDGSLSVENKDFLCQALPMCWRGHLKGSLTSVQRRDIYTQLDNVPDLRVAVGNAEQGEPVPIEVRMRANNTIGNDPSPELIRNQLLKLHVLGVPGVLNHVFVQLVSDRTQAHVLSVLAAQALKAHNLCETTRGVTWQLQEQEVTPQLLTELDARLDLEAEHEVRTTDLLALQASGTEVLYSSDIRQVERLLGIEAATAVYIREAGKLMDQCSKDVDPRHIHLLADQVSFNGTLQGLEKVPHAL